MSEDTSTTMSSSVVKVEPMYMYEDLLTFSQSDHLVGRNYFSWSQQVKFILKGRGLASHLSKNVHGVEVLEFEYWDQKDSRIMAWL